MEFVPILVVVGLTFGLCFLFDKGFTRLFRGKTQHKTGLAVRMNKRYALFGLVLTILGLMAAITGWTASVVLMIGGILVLLMGIALLVYYLSFGVYYDEDTFLLSSFGKSSRTYGFRDIREQRLYTITGGKVVVELHMTDHRAVSLHSDMEGTYAFLDHAFAAWCRQTGRDPENCDFHDPSKSCWFPSGEEA